MSKQKDFPPFKPMSDMARKRQEGDSDNEIKPGIDKKPSWLKMKEGSQNQDWETINTFPSKVEPVPVVEQIFREEKEFITKKEASHSEAAYPKINESRKEKEFNSKKEAAYPKGKPSRKPLVVTQVYDKRVRDLLEKIMKKLRKKASPVYIDALVHYADFLGIE